MEHFRRERGGERGRREREGERERGTYVQVRTLITSLLLSSQFTLFYVKVFLLILLLPIHSLLTLL